MIASSGLNSARTTTFGRAALDDRRETRVRRDMHALSGARTAERIDRDVDMIVACVFGGVRTRDRERARRARR